jgi:hypothetical protein
LVDIKDLISAESDDGKFVFGSMKLVRYVFPGLLSLSFFSFVIRNFLRNDRYPLTKVSRTHSADFCALFVQARFLLLPGKMCGGLKTGSGLAADDGFFL